MKEQIGALIKEIEKKRSHRALAQLLTAVERDPATALRYSELQVPHSFALRIGVTGPPGAGKSTLVAALLSEFKKEGCEVGVIAVDPSSPFSQGAILGDRLRFHEHGVDPQVFIRSVASRGALGGVSAAAYLMSRAMDFYGMDVVLIETVGVGQSELEIMNMADAVAVVLVPEFGDSVQAMKAGLLEIASLFVLNKSDRPGADVLARELEEWSDSAPVMKTIATEKKGVAEVTEFLENLVSKEQRIQNRFDPHRLQAEARSLLGQALFQKIAPELNRVTTPQKLYQFVTKALPRPRRT